MWRFLFKEIYNENAHIWQMDGENNKTSYHSVIVAVGEQKKCTKRNYSTIRYVRHTTDGQTDSK